MSNSNKKNHPVWSFYDRLRTARLNTLYYSRRLDSVERTNRVMDIIICIAAPTSAISSFFLWEYEYGKIAWQIFVVIAVTLAMIKPFLNLTEQVKGFASVLSEYKILEHDLRKIKLSIDQNKKYDAALQCEFERVIERERILVSKSPETLEKKSIKKICEIEVLEEFPKDSFYIPEEEQ